MMETDSGEQQHLRACAKCLIVVNREHEEPLSWEEPNLKVPKPCGWTFERHFALSGLGESYKPQGKKNPPV